MPENWKKYRLGDLIEVNKRSIRKGDLDWINYIDIKSVGTGFYEEPKRMNFEDSPSRARRLLKEGDTVISSVRPNLKSYFYSQNLKENTIASTGFTVLTPKNIDKRFLYYLTTNDNYINYLVQSCTGSAYPAFGPQVLLDSEVLIPESIQEQKSIASILTALDDKIELNLQMNKTLKEMAMALYKHWFVDFGPFQDGEFVESELGEIPKGWEVNGILELTDLLSGGTPKTKIAEYWDGTVNWVSAKDIGNGGNIYISDTEKKITEKGVQNSSTKILPSDTVILVARGSVGKFGMIAKPMAMNQSCYGLFSKGELSQGLVYLMCSNLIQQFKRVSYGSVFDTITTSTFKATNVISPPSAVIKELRGLIDPLFLELKNNIFENETLTQLRDTLLPKLISGAVRVKDAEKTLSEVL